MVKRRVECLVRGDFSNYGGVGGIMNGVVIKGNRGCNGVGVEGVGFVEKCVEVVERLGLKGGRE